MVPNKSWLIGISPGSAHMIRMTTLLATSTETLSAEEKVLASLLR